MMSFSLRLASSQRSLRYSAFTISRWSKSSRLSAVLAMTTFRKIRRVAERTTQNMTMKAMVHTVMQVMLMYRVVRAKTSELAACKLKRQKLF